MWHLGPKHYLVQSPSMAGNRWGLHIVRQSSELFWRIWFHPCGCLNINLPIHVSLNGYNHASLPLGYVNKLSVLQDAIAMAQMRLFIFYQPPSSAASFRPILSEPSGTLAPVPIHGAPTESQHAWQAAASL